MEQNVISIGAGWNPDLTQHRWKWYVRGDDYCWEAEALVANALLYEQHQQFSEELGICPQVGRGLCQ